MQYFGYKHDIGNVLRLRWSEIAWKQKIAENMFLKCE